MSTLLQPDFILEEAQITDAPAIAELQCQLALETEDFKLDLNTAIEGAKNLISDRSKGVYYKVVHKEAIVACVLTTFEWSDWRNGQVLWIQSLFVKAPFRGQGLYRAMYEYLQNLVQEREDLKGIRLYADKTNQKAIQVYTALGMNGEHYSLFEWMPED